MFDHDSDSIVEVLQRKLQTVAQSEYERRRRHLGQLTSEQERAIESLLQSTVNKLSYPLIDCMRLVGGANDAENMLTGEVHSVSQIED